MKSNFSQQTKRKFKEISILCLILLVIALYFSMRIGCLCRADASLFNELSKVFSNDYFINELISKPIYFSFGGQALMCMFYGVIIVLFIYLILMSKALTEPERVGEEHGSAGWASLKEISQYASNIKDKVRTIRIGNKLEHDIEETHNLVFTNNVKLATKRTHFDKVHDRNLNVAVWGGSGSGKTRNYVKPNLMQFHGNYFVTDPKGTVIDDCGHMFEKNGYDIKCFNLIPETMYKSMAYNPLYYIKTKEQILSFVNCLIKNTTPDKTSSSDPFWEKSETLLYISILSYLQDWVDVSDFTLPSLVEYIELAKVKESNEDYVSNLDKIFKEIETGYMCLVIDTDSQQEKEMIDYYLKYSKYCNNQSNKDMNNSSSDIPERTKTFLKSGADARDDIEIGEIDIPCDLISNRTGKSYWDLFYDFNIEPKDSYDENDPNYKELLIKIALKYGKPLSQEAKEIKEIEDDNNLTKFEKEKKLVEIQQQLKAKYSNNELISIGKEYVFPQTEKDKLFREDYYCVFRYKDFKQAAGETLKSIIISCNVRLAPTTFPGVRRILSGKEEVVDEIDSITGEKTGNKITEFTGKCEMELDNLGGISKEKPDNKMIIFAIMSDTDTTYNFLFALMMYQTLDLLCNKANVEFGGSLPRLVHMIFDEFANIGNIRDFDKTIAVTRSRNIAVSMILQTPFQLENNYKKEAAKVILDNCDTTLYLGGGSDGASESTCKEISARLGSQTIRVQSYGENRGRQGSTNINRQVQKRELMTSEEVARLPRDEAIVMIKQARPYRDKKFFLEKHSNYKYIDPVHKNMGLDINNEKIKEKFDFVKYKNKKSLNENTQNTKSTDQVTDEEFNKIMRDKISSNVKNINKNENRNKPEYRDNALIKRGVSPFLYDNNLPLNKLLFVDISINGKVNSDNSYIKEISIVDYNKKLIYQKKLDNKQLSDNDIVKIKNIIKDRIIVSYPQDYIKDYFEKQNISNLDQKYLSLVQIFAPIFGKKSKLYGTYTWPTFNDCINYYFKNEIKSSQNELKTHSVSKLIVDVYKQISGINYRNIIKKVA